MFKFLRSTFKYHIFLQSSKKQNNEKNISRLFSYPIHYYIRYKHDKMRLNKFERCPANGPTITSYPIFRLQMVSEGILLKTTPHQNYFNNTQKNVFVDSKGYLHLKIIKQGDKWVSSGLYNYVKPENYGSFVFSVANGYQKLDPRVVAGLFIYKDDENQIDIEISRWNRPAINNTQYVAQPAKVPGNQHRFNLKQEDTDVVHSFTWTSSYILFQTFSACSYSQVQKLIGVEGTKSPLLIREWKYTGPNIPPKTKVTICLNLWIYHMVAGEEASFKQPSDGKEQEIVIKEFKYIPL